MKIIGMAEYAKPAHRCSDEFPKINWLKRREHQGLIIECSCGKRYIYGLHACWQENIWMWKKYDGGPYYYV